MVEVEADGRNNKWASLPRRIQQQGLQRLSPGLTRKEILQAGHSQASPAGPSALIPHHFPLHLWPHQPGQPWPATSAAAVTTQMASCQLLPATGEKKRETRCLGTRGEQVMMQCALCPLSCWASLLAVLGRAPESFHPLGHYILPPVSGRRQPLSSFSKGLGLGE